MAVAALVVGILALPCASLYGVPGVILGIVAIFLGLRSRGRIKRSGGAIGGGALAMAGLIIGLIGAVLGALWALFLFALYQAMVSPGNAVQTPPALLTP